MQTIRAAFFAIFFVCSASADTLVRSSLVEVGQSVPYKGGTREIVEFAGYCVASNGDIFFSATVSLGGAGLWKIDGTEITEVLTDGTPVADNPGETWGGSFSNIAANASGKVVLFGLNNSNVAVVGTFHNGVGNRIATDDDPAPPTDNGLSFSAFSDVWINDDGTVAFTGSARGANPNIGGHPGVWIDSGAGLELLALGEVDSGPIPFDLANGDFAAFVKLEEGGSSGLFSRQGSADKALRLSIDAKIFDGQNDAFIAQFLGLAINASGKVAFDAFLVDDGDELVSYPTFTAQLPPAGMIEETEILFSNSDFFATPLSVNAMDSVLVSVEMTESDDGFSLRLYRTDGSFVPILVADEVIPGVAGGESVNGFRKMHGMLDDGDGVVVLLATQNTEVLLRAAFIPDVAEARRPVVKVKGPSRRTVRSTRIALRGTVLADSRPRVEVRLGSRPARRAVVNNNGNRWVSRKLALRPGRNKVRVRAVDATGLGSPFVRISVRRK